MVGQLRSFIVVCDELGIPNFESMNISKASVGGISIEQWADMGKEEFIQEVQNLSVAKKSLLEKYLKKCEELLG